MAFQMRAPGADTDDVQKSVRQIRSWLYQLNENLQYAFSNLDEENFTDQFLKTIGIGETPTLAERVRELSDRVDAAETGAWTTLSVQNASAWSGAYAPRYKRLGKMVFLSGGIALSAALAYRSSVAVASLPSGFRPAYDQALCAASDVGAVRLTVAPGGTVTLKNISGYQLATTHFVSLGCAFPL